MPRCLSSPSDEIKPEDGMRAACYHKHGKPDRVVAVETLLKPPPPGPGQLLVRVRAASLNPADWKSGAGEQAALLKFAWPRVYGFDFSGEVVAVGEDSGEQVEASGEESTGTQRFIVGDQVFGMIRGLPQANRGTLAEYVIVDSDICARCPSSVSHAGCASVPLVAITAVKMLQICGLKEKSTSEGGPRVLITGGAGGMGTIAIQLALKMFGASYVATTASAGAKTELCQRLGAARVVNYREEDFSEVLSSTEESELFDAILDCTGEAPKCVSLLKRGGALASILAGPTQEALLTWMAEAKLDPANVTTGVGAFLRSGWGGGLFQFFGGATKLRKACEARGASFAHVIGTGNGEIMGKVAALLASGEVQPVIDKEFTLEEALSAIQYQATGRAAGKVVVTVPERSIDPVRAAARDDL